MTINPLRTREPVYIPPRKAPTKAEKVAAWNRVNGVCELCGKPVALEGVGVQYDHEAMREITGDDSVANLRPTHPKCHQDKTSGHDIPLIAKVRRQEAMTRPKVKKAFGLSHPTLKRKMDGSVVPR